MRFFGRARRRPRHRAPADLSRCARGSVLGTCPEDGCVECDLWWIEQRMLAADQD